MTMHVTNYTLDTYIHPELSKFTSAEIPDLTGQFPQAAHWVGNHFLSSIFFGQFPSPVRQIVIGIMRRTHVAFAAYHQGRKAALDYLALARTGRSLSTYFDALNRWETFALNYVMLVDLYVNKLGNGRKLFEKNDGSCSDRLYRIGNKVKHLSPEEYGPADTVPLWLSNAGLQSFGVTVTYAEAAGELRQLAENADLFENPKAFMERFAAARIQPATPE